MKRTYRDALIGILFATAVEIFGAAHASALPPRKVAILIFDEVENIDFTGPMQVFAVAGYETFTVAASRVPIEASGGLTVVPQYTFADAPQADVVVIPGGNVDHSMMDPATLDWIKGQAARGQHVLSVCNGAFILAHAGVLDGLLATTTRANIPSLRQHSPTVKVTGTRRVVDNGKFITAGGFSAGIDGALHVILRLQGKGHADYVAQMLEYDWRPAGGHLPGMDALRLLPMFLDQKLAEFARVDGVLDSTGNVDRWRISVLLTTEDPRADLLKSIGTMLASYGNWGPPTNLHKSRQQQWTFRDDAGRRWNAYARLDNARGLGGQQVLSIALRGD